MNNYLNFLEKNKLFSGLSSTETSNLMNLISPQHYESGQDICAEGDVAESMYIIFEGEVEIWKKDEKSQDSYIITTLTSGVNIGELSFLNDKPRSATITTLTPVTILVLPFKALSSLKESQLIQEQILYYKFIENIAKAIGEHLISTTQTLSDLLRNKTIEQEVQAAKCGLFAGFFSM